MKQKFYKDDSLRNPNFWYSYKRIMSFGTHHISVIGARGIGKTYGALGFCIDRWNSHKEEFVWCRDTEEALKELRANHGYQLFGKISKDKKYKIDTYDIRNDVIYVNEEPCGRLMSLSTFYKYKGSTFIIRNFVIDEFVPEIGQVVRGNRRRAVQNVIESVLRLQGDYKIIFLANALNKYDPIMKIFDVDINQGFGIYVNRETDCAVHYADSSEEYKEAHRSSAAGKLSKDSGKEYNENIFIDTDIYYHSLPPKIRVWYVVHSLDGTAFRIACKDDMLYCYLDTDRMSYQKLRFCTRKEVVSKDIKLISQPMKKSLLTFYNNGRLLFEDGFVRNLFLEEFNCK